jgi:hypothetical protein
VTRERSEQRCLGRFFLLFFFLVLKTGGYAKRFIITIHFIR